MSIPRKRVAVCHNLELLRFPICDRISHALGVTVWYLLTGRTLSPLNRGDSSEADGGTSIGAIQEGTCPHTPSFIKVPSSSEMDRSIAVLPYKSSHGTPTEKYKSKPAALKTVGPQLGDIYRHRTVSSAVTVVAVRESLCNSVAKTLHPRLFLPVFRTLDTPKRLKYLAPLRLGTSLSQ